MKQSVEVLSDNYKDFNFSAACRKHPASSSVGICAYCLKEKLVKLVCSECGEQKLSSCSCSDDVSSSYRNSCSTMEVGSVGRVSFLIENDKIDPQQIFNPNPRSKKGDEAMFLRRSASTSTSSRAEVKKSNGFWKIKSLFKKRTKRSEICVPDVIGVPRSRSLCSFRPSDFDGENKSAKLSDVVTSGCFLDPDRRFGGFSECEPRKSGFRCENFDFRGAKKQNLVDFSSMDKSSGFIDLKVDFKEFSGGIRRRRSFGSDHGGYINEINSKRNGVLGDCRTETSGGKSRTVWKWIFKYHHPSNKTDR